MRQRLTDIETALLRIDGATFQRTCDEYLFCRYGADFRHITCTGTQIGRMQTTKGTPDTYVILPNGKYVLIEYTKQQTGVLKKLQGDVAKCLNAKETGLSVDQIDRILIIHASKLTPKQQEALRKSCPKQVKLEIIGLGELALSIHNDFRQLARRYLDIAFDTLQLQTPDEFIGEHARKAVGENNPLSNPLRYREDELQLLLGKINSQDVTVLTGGQGVGKTRLALEVLEKYCQINLDYQPFCIANKYASLLEDLSDLVQSRKKYIFLIDDANRQTPILLETLEHLYARPEVSFKIILTVRDYAFDVVSKHLQPYRWDWYSIEKFTDEQIVKLIAEKPFSIGNHGFQQRIRDLANGNPRLAIMAAKLALKEQNLYALNDATDLYVSYYDSLTDSDNKSLLVDPTRLKVLGLLAVFRQIDLLQESFVSQLTSAFGLTRDILAAELVGLEKDELADVYLTDQSFFRLSDQNLAIYAVYQVFVDKKLLSVEALLTEFFEDYPQRIRDAFYGVINAFDQERIINDIKLVTNQYYSSIRSDDAKAYKFLDVFFIALPTETLDYLLVLSENLPSLQKQWREKNILWRLKTDEGPLKDRLRLLFNFFSGFNNFFNIALELLVKFAESTPDLVPLLTSLIKDRLAFRPEDGQYMQLRQALLLQYLIDEMQSGHEAARSLLFAVLPSFLQSEFRSTISRGHGITITTMPYPVQEPFSSLRSTLWEFVSDQFSKYPEECRSVLFSYTSSYSPLDNELLREFDKGHIIPLIEQHLRTNDFDDCHFVNEYVRFLNRSNLQSTQTNQLAERFQNHEYSLYLLLDWRRHRGRDADDEMWKKPEQYRLKKQNELWEKLHPESLLEIEQLFDEIFDLISKPVNISSMLDHPLETILSGIRQHNPELFKETVAAFSLREWPLTVPVSRIVGAAFNYEIAVPEEWFSVFFGAKYRNAEWQLNFFSMIPASAVTIDWANKLIQCFQEQSIDGFYLPDKWWMNYRAVRPTIYQDILTILTFRHEQIGMRYSLWHDFFEDRIDLFNESDLPLLKKVYLQLFKMERLSASGFDYSHNNLKAILSHDPSFLINLIEAHYKQSDTESTDHPQIENLAFVWSLPDAVKWALQIVHIMVNQERFVWYGRNYEPFFLHVSEEQKGLTHIFLDEYIKIYANNVSEIGNMIQALQHIHKYDEWLLCVRAFLTYNQSVEDFKKISWAPGMLSGSGKVNFDQVRADRLKQVLQQVQQMPKKLPFLEHIKYLEWYITIYEKAAEEERRRQFGGDD
ncbi:hypothetical protein [Spirosoma sp.]|uniref:nSTAND3 domain-containing NTPase n=1 Tax=Spirosoma sp. TaxID=1899569 RepID=UPI0026023518|nr:hypothetical protein [Spirosoma sp.]MCX6215192.1 hypothetical protein [Spirosoma sp.]